jgi:hypothetical protein
MFFLAYIQTQFIAYAYFLNSDNEHYMRGKVVTPNPLEDGPTSTVVEG